MKIRAKKSLGQNFLHDTSVIERIVGALGIDDKDTVIEIGPGTGALTEELVKTGAKIVAVEFDRELVPLLEQQFRFDENFSLVNTDALNVHFASIVDKPKGVKLVANLPYNISTPILQRLIEQRHMFSSLVLMFQREVVERIVAKPATKERGFLSVIAQTAFDIEYLFDVAPGSFRPVPKVWSSVTRVIPKAVFVGDEKLFRNVVSRSFAQKRKTILNNLKGTYPNATLILASADIDANRRAETLTIDEWQTLTAEIEKGRG
ncbi:MAG: 16S rRNA (adenine(1518)-N(6)/adenine(1519)-N(6))-dimethyltransferase RsmA [Pyrinomonadaceae bacterium]